MKQEASFFEGKSPVLVYIAKRLKDALRLEQIFTEAGLDFGVEADEYRAGVVFRTVRAGAFFYVLPERRARLRCPGTSTATRRTSNGLASGTPRACLVTGANVRFPCDARLQSIGCAGAGCFSTLAAVRRSFHA